MKQYGDLLFAFSREPETLTVISVKSEPKVIYRMDFGDFDMARIQDVIVHYEDLPSP